MRNKPTPLLPDFALACLHESAKRLLADALDPSSSDACDGDAQVCLTLAGGAGTVAFSAQHSLGGDADLVETQTFLCRDGGGSAAPIRMAGRVGFPSAESYGVSSPPASASFCHMSLFVCSLRTGFGEIMTSPSVTSHSGKAGPGHL